MDEQGNNNYTPYVVCIENGVCERERPENCFNCPADCCVDCDPATITPAEPRDFLVAEMRWTDFSQEEPIEIGLDLDGDGEIDNTGGDIVAILDNYLNRAISKHLNRRIERGELLMVVRLYVDSFQHDATVLAQVLPVESVDGTPLFDGNDEVMLAPGAVVDGFSCGAIVDGELVTYSQPGDQPLQCPICPSSDELVSFQIARLEGTVAWQQLTDMDIAGGMLREDIHRVFLPDMVDLLNETIVDDIANGNGNTANIIADLFDANCVVIEDQPGCEDVEAGVGECDYSADPPFISYTELLCNALLYGTLSPDLDIDGDGEGDLTSIGWRVSAVPVTVIDGT